MLDSHAPFPVTLLNMKENVQLQRISLVLVFSSKIMLSVHYFFYFFQVGSMFKCKMQAGTTYTDKHN